ncbi:Fic family protein [Paremcibacter congregatus]|nr:Fic family protein [Paremcibacter congregatus]
MEKVHSPEYLYWSKIKRKDWLPEEMEAEEFWAHVKAYRQINFNDTPILDDGDLIFRWFHLSRYAPFLHEIDLHMGGHLMGQNHITDNEKLEYVSRGLMEEAIASSQLEGAHTTRVVAKKMLIEGRAPQDKAEHMILNNYKTMKAIEQEFCKKDLSLDMLNELHVMITQNTLPKDAQGVFRTDEDKIVISPKGDDQITYICPKIAFVEQELPRLIAFANDQDLSDFIHPVIKAIMLHFWLAILHPYMDGNGRLARVLFYWYLLKHDYWAFAYLPISEMIKKSPGQYSQAYVYSEQDDNDLTYFIDYNIRKIKQARDTFSQYIARKKKDKEVENQIVRSHHDFNKRQLKLLVHFYQNPGERTNVSAQSKIHQVTRVPAAQDLKKLQTSGYLTSQKQGKLVYYYPTAKVKDLFREDTALKT